jgi:alcohol dehydrogenase (cytochrome c)
MLERSRYRIAIILALAFIAAFAAWRAEAVGEGGQPAPTPIPQILQNYKPVTTERLKKPDSADWLMGRRTYDGWGYSPLVQITAANVARLRPVWVFSTGVNNGHEAPPIVNGGAMFVATPGNQVIAIDAGTGGVLWRYRRPLPEGASVGHPTSRGVALHGDKVFFAAGEAVLVALDAVSGKEVWTTTVAENKLGY